MGCKISMKMLIKIQILSFRNLFNGSIELKMLNYVHIPYNFQTSS